MPIINSGHYLQHSCTEKIAIPISKQCKCFQLVICNNQKNNNTSLSCQSELISSVVLPIGILSTYARLRHHRVIKIRRVELCAWPRKANARIILEKLGFSVSFLLTSWVFQSQMCEIMLALQHITICHHIFYFFIRLVSSQYLML